MLSVHPSFPHVHICLPYGPVFIVCLTTVAVAEGSARISSLYVLQGHYCSALGDALEMQIMKSARMPPKTLKKLKSDAITAYSHAVDVFTVSYGVKHPATVLALHKIASLKRL